MQSSISLQEPFSFAFWPILLCGGVALGCALVLLLLHRKGKVRVAKPQKVTPVLPSSPATVAACKNKYLKQLEQIRQASLTGQLSVRSTYQQLSLCIRNFIYEMTGTNVVNYTLADIKQLKLPTLERLMEEYYTQEFPYQTQADACVSIENTKKAIEQWN